MAVSQVRTNLLWKPFRQTNPRLPAGIFYNYSQVAGDATGGALTITFTISPSTKAPSLMLYSIEDYYIDMVTGLNLSGVRVLLTSFDEVLNGVSPIWDRFHVLSNAFAGRSGMRGDEYVAKPLGGRPFQQRDAATIQMVFDWITNTNGDQYGAGFWGYFWNQDPWANGGPEKPLL
jgi:hypothetical protein